MRFIKENDYKGYIKPELKITVCGAVTNNEPSINQVNAEDTAISTITEYLGGRYDCAAIFTPWDGTGTDTRNKHIIKLVIALALYYLYHQTGMKDIPEHRKVDYDDAISWLKDAGRGTVRATLPVLTSEQNLGEIRWNSQKPTNNRW